MNGLISFLVSQLMRKEFYLLLLVNFTAALMIAWRGSLQNDIFHSVDLR